MQFDIDMALQTFSNEYKPKSCFGDDKISVRLVIEKSQTDTLAQYEETVEAMLANPRVVRKLGGYLEGIKLPLKDGDLYFEEHPLDCYKVLQNSYFIDAKTTPELPPRIVDIDGRVLTDPDEIAAAVYDGCLVEATVNFFAYNYGDNRGISAWLLEVRKLEDGTPLDGREVTSEAEGDDSDYDDLI